MNNPILRATSLSIFVLTLAAPVYAQNERLRVTIAGVELPADRVRSVVVDSARLEVDRATIEIESPRAFAPSVGDSLGVAATDRANTTVFKGEIVAIEPVFEAGGESRVIVRAFNRLHRLARSTNTRVYEDQTDSDIASAIAQAAGLDFAPAGPEAMASRQTVYQHNQTDLEFLRARAARIGYEVFVDDRTLFFRRRPASSPVLLACTSDADAQIRIFHSRTASAQVVKKVTVRGWDPEKKEEIVAEATRPMIPLSAVAASILVPPGPSVDLGFVPQLPTTEAAYGAANGALSALTAPDLAAEADAEGDAALVAGATVSIDQVNNRFNGDYFVIGATHRFAPGSRQGWHTMLRLVRLDRAVFILPEVGDEVLVAFLGGDLNRPVIVGSLWNSEDTPPETRLCRATQN
ncbi:MAG TPA: contractile injection system protein, VgrG/Pvc8 family [Terriglobia bacterium]|nr:contractile injection system protein, VgrG/Pvc8 family [Terriglobia bacterium]